MLYLCIAVALLLLGLYAARTERVTPNGLDSEYTCEVVRIASIRPHPGADKLDLALFTTRDSGDQVQGYEVVVGRGEFVEGDLAVYVSVDCVVPLSGPFAFLKNREDAKNKDHFRIRAARIRGVYSQGLLIPPPAGTTGDNYGAPVAELLGVTYHREPTPVDIATGATQKKVRPQPVPVYGVTSLKKVPNAIEPGTPVHVTEKIHGSNFRFGWIPRKVLGIRVGWHFFVGSHQVEKGDANPNGGYYGTDIWAAYAEDNALKLRTEYHKGLVFYGELFGKARGGRAIQDMTYGRDLPDAVVFDVLRLSGQRWLPLLERRELLDALGFKSPPDLMSGPYNAELVAALAEGHSLVPGAGHIREGVVVENLSPGATSLNRKVKFVGQGYLLRKEEK